MPVSPPLTPADPPGAPTQHHSHSVEGVWTLLPLPHHHSHPPFLGTTNTLPKKKLENGFNATGEKNNKQNPKKSDISPEMKMVEQVFMLI